MNFIFTFRTESIRTTILFFMLAVGLAALGCMKAEPNATVATDRELDASPSYVRTPDAIFKDLERLRISRPDMALSYARLLVEGYSDSPEAKQAKAIIPELEKVIKKKADEERRAKQIGEEKRRQEVLAEAERKRKQALTESERERKQALADKWSYSKTVDEMTSGSVRQAVISSENSVEFNSPYDGHQRARLIIRTHPSYGRDVIFSIERGQILCSSYSGCKVRVRFGSAKPETWQAAESSDHDSTVIFLLNHDRFLKKLRESQTVRIQVEVYREGAPSFEFQVSGFDYKAYTSK